MMRLATALRSAAQQLGYCLVAGLLVVGLGLLGQSHASAAKLQNRSLRFGSSIPSALTQYDFSFGLSSGGTLGSLIFEVCSNDPLVGTPCTAPSGFNAGSAALVNQTGATGFSMDPSSNGNYILLTRPAASEAVGQAVSYSFSPVTNPDAAGSYYVRLSSYASSDGTGTPVDTGGVAFSINPEVTLSTQVPPFLAFCLGITIINSNCATATGDSINFGELSRSSTARATSQMLAATNVADGYNIQLTGSTMTAGNYTIEPMTGQAAVPGLSQFGLNAWANGIPPVGQLPNGPGSGQPTANYAIANRYQFVSGDTIVSTTTSDDSRTYTVSYVVNVPQSQHPGRYVTTLSYLASANF